MHNIIALHTIRNIGWIIVCCPDVRSIILRLAEVLDSLNIGLIEIETTAMEVLFESIANKKIAKSWICTG